MYLERHPCAVQVPATLIIFQILNLACKCQYVTYSVHRGFLSHKTVCPLTNTYMQLARISANSAWEIQPTAVLHHFL